MSRYFFRGLFVLTLAFYGCIGSQSIMSRGMQSRAAIDGDGVPITMDTTLDYIDMSATTVKDLKEFIVPGYEDKVTASQVENIITNSIRVSTVIETVGNWTWVDGEYKEADDDIKTFGLWYKDGKWHAYVTDILTPKAGQRSIFQTASVEGNESDTSVTMNFSELGSNFTFTRNGDKVLTSYEVEVYTAELDEATGATKTEKTKLEVEGLKMYKSEPFMDMGKVTNCHYLVVNESDKGNITRFGNAPAAPDAEEILIKSESNSETGKLIGYFVRIKKKDVLGLVYKHNLEGFATESDLLSFYYPDGNVTNMSQITTNGIEYAVGSDGGAYVVSGNGLSGHVVLPWKVTIGGSEYNVTAIGESAFNAKARENNSFTRFTAPITVNNIGLEAFSDYSFLTFVSLPSATSIRNLAFVNCSSLYSVSLPSATSIGNVAFANCSNLYSVSLPSATSIGNDVFQDCSSLNSISFPSATSIGNSAFQDCSNLYSVSLPSATIIGNSAFQGCSYLASVSLPSAESIGNSAFQDCSFLYSVSLPSATIIGNSAFQGCSYLTSVSLPSATSIGDASIADCESLTSVYIPSVTSIGMVSFALNSSLTFINFGSSPKSEVPSLYEYAFAEVPNTCRFIIPLGMYDEWIAAPGWSDLYAAGYKFEGYASTEEVSSLSESMQGKRDLTDNVAVADSAQFTEWKFHCDEPAIQAALDASPVRLDYDSDMERWVFSNLPEVEGWIFTGNTTIPLGEDISTFTSGTMYVESPDEINEVKITATREKITTTKAGEAYVTTTFVTNSIAAYEAMKRKLDQIAALEPPSSTVRDLITWANAVQSILKGDLIGGDSGLSPAAVLSASNKYYWDKQTETCYRMTVENDYTIMRAVTNVPPTVEVVLALEKELNKETSK